MAQLTEQEIAERIVELMIESPDPLNPNPEHNAYNWGLAHAQLVINGGSVEAIKKARPQ
jgi:hypothetical protein